ncbi:PREDICTED: mitochondrial inner membrane protein OXA1L [Eufriesea mexicana]|uniref:mitochondrial inner membrane protein OXA1L n=1 Tax=Eufriesea mexicana TaxID=516756 RepID=UPI00083C41FE|nr:PREDICTED: mitochondrial inner membrane protein OXA1L [Eufriesea mexicana]
MFTRLCIRVSRELLNTTGYRKTIKCQFSGLIHNSINNALKKDCIFDVHRLSKSNRIYVIRYESTVNTTVKDTISNTDLSIPQTQEIAKANSIVPENNLISEIPDLPVSISEGIKEITQVIKYHANGEPTFESLGLGGYGPIGLIQSFYEFVHINCSLPWWLTIMLISILLKLAMFPTSVSTQRNNAKMQLIIPQIVQIQEKMTDARKCGNMEEAAISASQLQQLLKGNNVKLFPLANFAKVGVHLPIFIALRGMSNQHIESLQHGGFLWLPDLTGPDPYYILPLCTSVTMYCVTALIMQQSTAQNIPPLMLKLCKGIPVISFLFSMNFPGTVLCHWVVCNILTLAENEILKLKAVKRYFNIPNKPPINLSTSKEMKKPERGFRQSFHEAWDNMRISHKLSNYEKADTMQFNEAAKGPLKKTFNYNPLNDLSRRETTTSMKAMKK